MPDQPRAKRDQKGRRAVINEVVYALGLVYGFWLYSNITFKVATAAIFGLLTFTAWAEVWRPDLLEKMAKALEPRRP